MDAMESHSEDEDVKAGRMDMGHLKGFRSRVPFRGVQAPKRQLFCMHSLEGKQPGSLISLARVWLFPRFLLYSSSNSNHKPQAWG